MALYWKWQWSLSARGKARQESPTRHCSSGQEHCSGHGTRIINLPQLASSLHWAWAGHQLFSCFFSFWRAAMARSRAGCALSLPGPTPRSIIPNSSTCAASFASFMLSHRRDLAREPPQTKNSKPGGRSSRWGCGAEVVLYIARRDTPHDLLSTDHGTAYALN